MTRKNKKIIILKRLFFWTFYIFSGIVLYLKKGYIFYSLITFTRVVYPLSIFWLQIRIKKTTNFLPIDSKMTTAQLWFNLLPILWSIFAVIFSVTNALLYIFEQLSNF